MNPPFLERYAFCYVKDTCEFSTKNIHKFLSSQTYVLYSGPLSMGIFFLKISTILDQKIMPPFLHVLHVDYPLFCISNGTKVETVGEI